MLRLVKTPRKLEPFLKEFSDMFTHPSHKSFSDMISAVSVCDKSKTISNLTDTMANDREGKKARSSYNWFFTDAKWDESKVAQRKATLFFEAMNLCENDRLLLIIDDTYAEKEGDCIEGVGEFYDHSEDRYINGNNFVTSVLQSKGLFIPHKAKMYIKKEDARGDDFRTKIDIAFEDIIEPLKIPNGVELYVVFDRGWFSAEFINDCRNLGYHITCRIKSDKIVNINKDMSFHVEDLANQIDRKYYKKIFIKVRGKKKSYYVFEKEVTLSEIGTVRLVISKKNQEGDLSYFISTNDSLSSKEILSMYEDRWDIETAHREANQKLGFKDYQLRTQRSIERFIQVVFSVWTALLLVELENPIASPNSNRRTLGQMVDNVKDECIIELIISILNHFNLPIPDGGLLYKLKSIGYSN
jgi:hypothetical protein